MLAMLADPSLSDVSLVVEDIEVPAHKAVLGKETRLRYIRETCVIQDSLPDDCVLSQARHLSKHALYTLKLGLSLRWFGLGQDIHHPNLFSP